MKLLALDDEHAPRKTLSHLRGPFMERVTMHNSATGISGYRIAIDGFMTVTKATFPEDVMPEDVMAYVNAQRNEGYAQRTIGNRVARLKAFLKYAGVPPERLPKQPRNAQEAQQPGSVLRAG